MATRAVTDVAAAGTILIGTLIIAGCVADDAVGVISDDVAIAPTAAAVTAATNQLQPTLEAINKAFNQLSQSIQSNAPSLIQQGA